jgi:putative ABC transport system permease protein
MGDEGAVLAHFVLLPGSRVDFARYRVRPAVPLPEEEVERVEAEVPPPAARRSFSVVFYTSNKKGASRRGVFASTPLPRSDRLPSDEPGAQAMDDLLQDLKYALRQLWKNPAYTLAAVLTLALGIGANTAIFSVIRSVVLRPLPFRHGGEIVHLGYTSPASGLNSLRFSVQELGDYRRQTEAFSDIAEYHSMAFSLLGWGEPDRVQTGVVSANFFDELGVKPELGRGFRPEDEQLGADHVLLLTHDYWMRRFGGTPTIVGKRLEMNDRSIEVIGILPPLPAYPGKDDVFMPTAACPFRSNPKTIQTRSARMLYLFARLRPGISLAQARIDATTINSRLAQQHPESQRKDAKSIDLGALEEELTGAFRPTLLVLAATVGLVLLLACANVANLLLARLLSRQKEIVVRAAIGAGRRRLVHQLLTESVVLALLGGAIGIALAYASLGLLVAFASHYTPRADEISIDATVLLFTLAVTVLTGLAFGVVPALQVSRQDLGTSLRESRSTASVAKHRFRSALVVVQVAVSFILLVGAGLMVRTLLALQRVDAGFNSENVLTMTLALPFSKYTGPQQSETFFDSVLEQVKRQPRVLQATIGNDVPLAGQAVTPTIRIEHRITPPGETEPQADVHLAGDDYLRTLDIPLLRGRDFTSADTRSSTKVAWVNQAMAKKYFPGDDPLDHRVQLGSTGWVTIVGIVGDVKENALSADAGPGIYFSFHQIPTGTMRLFVRTAGDPESLLPDIRRIVHGVDPEQPIAEVQTLAKVRQESLAPSRLTAMLLVVFATLAFAITATGLSGIISFSVSERTQEIGIRSALGASRSNVLRTVLRESAGLILIGLLLGAAGSLALGRVLSALLYGVAPTDVATLVAVGLLLPAVVAVACLPPAWKATAIDPMVALRAE